MFKRIIALIKKEFITIWKDPKSRSMVIILPIMQLLVFANAITMEVKNIDTVVFDNDRTQMSRELISYFDASPRFRKIIYANNEQEVKRNIELQKAQIGIEIQNSFSKSIKAKKTTTVQIIADGRQTNTASIASSYAAQIVNNYSKTVSPQGASVSYEIRNWFNENLNYQWYVLQVLVTLLALVITLLLTALSIARERELGTFDQLIVSPLTSFEILVGKTLPPLMIAMSLTCFMSTLVITVFGVPFRGSFLLFFASALVALLAIVGVGLFISSICKTQQQAILGVLTFQMPAVLLSGFISPIRDMPVFLQYVTLLNPIRFFIEITRGIFFKNMGVGDVFLNLIPLIIIATLTLSLAGWTFKRNLE